MPPFDAAYATCPTWPSKAAIEAVLTHTPRSPSSSGSLPFMAAAANRSTLNVPIRLMRSTVSNGISWCGPRLDAVRSAHPTPAQLMLTRNPSPWAAACSTAASTCPSSLTSHRTKFARSPSSLARASPLSAFRSAIVTSAPPSCSARTVASPRPDAPPATSAPEPAIFIGAEL